ncbi:transmembrane protein C1orf162 homolog [Echinops telfairi]|uniref:Transmembrane protein C1orf162 homolog n=1 Tax=Echinops telfairi TaxID=9371 RepID=A0ABM0ZPK5_ECHTE|nr:transmembrane protein C1orf162 homolog [Echinops telfairi]
MEHQLLDPAALLRNWLQDKETHPSPTPALCPDLQHQKSTQPTATTTAKAPSCFAPDSNKEPLHLVLAFCAGVLLTLLLMALVFLIIKSYRKCHSSSQVLDPPVKLSATSQDSLTYATMAFRTSAAKSSRVTDGHLADQDPVVYAQIKEVN